jgi:molecular chaperone DnaK
MQIPDEPRSALMYTLGIDLGTTFTAAAIWRNGHAETVSLGSRGAAIPSVVLLREDETFLTGEGANRRGLSEPHRVAREFKRRMGDTTPILLGGVPYSAEALTARLLRAVIDEVAQREGGAPAAISISHPANWGPYKTDLLLQAVRLAGLDEPVSFTTEPEAAAVFYAQQQRIEPGTIVAVYDLGGGTFDAAVLRKTAVGFEILGRPEGIERLGGIDFDAAVFSHVVGALGGKVAELDEDDPTAIAAVARLRDECVQAKEALSADTDVSIPVLLPNISTEVRLTRSELEAMVRPALHDSIEALKRALRSANVTPDQLHAVLLVGGSSRMPIVSQLVGAELGRPVAVDAHPKHAVPLGAAWLASGALSAQAAPRAVAGPAVGVAPGAAGTNLGSAPTSVLGSGQIPASLVAASAPMPRVPVSPAPAPVAAAGPAVGPAVGQGVGPAVGSAVGAAAGAAARASVPVGPARVGNYGGMPPAPPSAAPRAPLSPKLVILAAGLAVLVLLGGGGLAFALTRGNADPGVDALGPTEPAPSESTTAAAPPPIPLDEQCTDAIKANTRWVCLTKATMSGNELRVEYEAGNGGSPFNINGGFHLHLYGTNADGSDPADTRMGSNSNNQGTWYIEDQNPSVHPAGSSQYQAIGTMPKICARIAQGGHRLVPDANGTFKTGNCVPVTRA